MDIDNNNNFNNIDQVYIEESRKILITRHRGFAGIYRNSFEFLEGASYFVFAYILLHCNFQDNPNFVFDNKIFPLKRGQLVTSYQVLSKKTKLSRQQLRTVFTNLQHLHLLIINSTNELTNKASLITIIDIDKYLVNPDEITNLPTTDQPTNNQRPTIINKDNNDNNEINNDFTNISTDKLSLSEKSIDSKKIDRKEIAQKVLDENWQKAFIEKKYPFVESVDLYPEFEKMSEWIANPKHKIVINVESFSRNWIDKIVSKLPPHEQTLKDDFKVLLYDEKLNQTYKQDLKTVRIWLDKGIMVYNSYRKIYTKTGIKL